MRVLLLTAILLIPTFAVSDCVAQGRYMVLVDTPQEGVKDEEAILSEIQTLLAQLHRSRRSDQSSTMVLWKRWTHAVCIGCDRTPRGLRVVHTYPSRVLAGVLSTTDDEQERRGRRL